MSKDEDTIYTNFQKVLEEFDRLLKTTKHLSNYAAACSDNVDYHLVDYEREKALFVPPPKKIVSSRKLYKNQ